MLDMGPPHHMMWKGDLQALLQMYIHGGTSKIHHKDVPTPVDVGVPLHWYASEGGGGLLGNWGMAESEWYIMVEASKPHRLHPTSILYICKVF
jgi:hypothetical protein